MITNVSATTEQRTAHVPCALPRLPQKFDVLWRRGGPSSSGQTPWTYRPPPSPGYTTRSRAREAALPTVPERRRTAGSASAAAIPTLIGVSLSQHCPGRRRHPTWGPWPSSERSTGPATPSTPCSTSHRRAPGGLPARGGGDRRRRGPAAVRRARVPGVSDVRRVGTGRGAVSVRGLRASIWCRFRVKGGVVSQLRWPADDGARRASGGRGVAVGAGAAVGPDGAVSAPVPDGVESRTEPRGAAGVHTRAARRVRARRPGVRRAGWTHRPRHRDAARRRRVEREPALSPPRAGRSVHRSARGRAGVSAGAGTERRRGRGSAGDDPPAGATAAGAPGPGARRRPDGAGRSPSRTSPP